MPSPRGETIRQMVREDVESSWLGARWKDKLRLDPGNRGAGMGRRRGRLVLSLFRNAIGGVVLFPRRSAYRYHGDNHPKRRSFRATKHDVTIEAPFGRPFRAGLVLGYPQG
jgi:hypothetical protein